VNAVFTGVKMLATACNGWEEDKAMFEKCNSGGAFDYAEDGKNFKTELEIEKVNFYLAYSVLSSVVLGVIHCCICRRFFEGRYRT
jgi:guanyl-specific ribonuclease Sa